MYVLINDPMAIDLYITNMWANPLAYGVYRPNGIN